MVTESPNSQGRQSFIENLAFFYWLISSLKTAILPFILLDDTSTATLVLASISFGFAFFLLTLSPIYKDQAQEGDREGSWVFKAAILYVVWALVSLVWTLGNVRISGAGYLLAVAADLIVVTLLFKLGRRDLVAFQSWKGIVVGTVVLGLLSIFLFSANDTGRLGGSEMLHPNTLGNQMAIACLGCLFLLTDSNQPSAWRFVWSASFVILLFTLLQTLSKTSISAFAVSAFIYLLFSSISTYRKVLFGCISLVVIALAQSSLATYLDMYLNKTQDGMALETISGRTYIWEKTWEMIQANPLLGYGAMSYKSLGPILSNIQRNQAHNEWMQIWFCYGLPGVGATALLYGALLILAWNARRVERTSRAGLLGLSFAAYALIHGLTEASTIGISVSLALVLLVGCNLQRPKERVNV